MMPATLPRPRSQRGAGLLSIVAVLGVLLVLVQGGVYYKSRGSSKFLGSERSKVQAQQMAEAGVEANIGDLGRRKTRIRAGLADTPTYVDKAIGGGKFTSRLTTVSLGAAADTVDLVSTGRVGKGEHTVRARLKLRKVLDTAVTTTAKVVKDSTLTVATKTKVDTTLPANPASKPPITSTAAYAACMGNAALTKCQICHLAGGVIATKQVLTVLKGTISSVHGSHVGDYVGSTCSDYDTAYVTKTVPDSTWSVTSTTAFDTAVKVDTLVKVRILSWK